MKKLPLIRWCILETTRLRAPGAITRKVLKPVKILVSFGLVLSVYFARILLGNSLSSIKHEMTLKQDTDKSCAATFC